jgi:DNA-binding GntR family transcriptional regulator
VTALPASADLHIQHKSMTDTVADRLRRLIVSRELAPGQRIRQAELAEMLGVSTMPIREALLRLVADGMVIAESNRSFSVADTTEDDIRDIYWMHATFAGELTARAWDNKTPELIETLTRHHLGYQRALAANDLDVLNRVNWEFHAALNLAAGAPTVVRALSNTLHYFPSLRSEVPGWAQVAGKWQAGVLTQFKSGDREKAREVATSSIQRAAEMFIQSIWSPSEEPAPRAKGRTRASAKRK